MKPPKKRRNRGGLADYVLADRYLSRADVARGKPSIIEARAPDDANVLIKIWPRKEGQDDADLAEIWRHELRQLLRLAGHPGIGDRIAALYATHVDPEAFYVVLDSGQRRPLHAVLDSVAATHWLKSPRTPSSRLKIWLNFSRAATALEILHSQGLLHRNIDNWAILTSGSDEPDFQLTGFEWSMRLASGESGASRKSGRRANEEFDSFQADWAALGELFAALLGVDAKRLRNLELTPLQVADHMDALEVRLLRQVVAVEPVDGLDGDYIGEKISEVTGRLETNVAKQETSYRLVVRLGARSKLSEEIRRASDRRIESDDTEAQLNFIRDDLEAEALLVATRVPGPVDVHRFVLRGHQLNYRIEQYRHPNQANASWDFAYCEFTESHAPNPRSILGKPVQLAPGSIQVLTAGEAAESFSRMRRRVASWEGLRGKVDDGTDHVSEEQAKLRSLALSQLVEMAFAVADIFPVQIVGRSAPGTQQGDGSEANSSYSVRLVVRPDQDRDSLAEALGLKKAAAQRLDELLQGERGDGSGWTLTDTAILGDRSVGESEWSFSKVATEGHRQAFVFQGKTPAPAGAEGFLIPASSVGAIAQFKRRIKALEALSDHFELLRMIADPRAKLFDSQEVPVEDDEHFKALDIAKQGAIRELSSILPLYLIQGPPGVGKTRLVTEVVRRRFQNEPATRLLLTAQSHAAVDHLMLEVLSSLEGTDGELPLIVRCRKKDDVGNGSPWDIREQAKKLSSSLAASTLLGEGSSTVQKQIRDMATSEDAGSQRSRSAFEGVVMRSANMVFATTNSGELERLIEERGQFDWTIVEEAGKATGSELVSPLLLSHRRLMIGDHKQLPPYRSVEMRKILESSKDLVNVIKVAPALVSRSLRGSAVDELLEDWDDEAAEGIGSAAVESLLMFETMIENEFARQSRATNGRNIAKKLTVQHRMHPDIADLVSRVFYNGALVTDEDRRIEFARRDPPYSIIDASALPRSPIAIVDMPDIQAAMHLKQGDRPPRWWNEDELTAVVNVLASIRARPDGAKKPSLAILSPYAEQVRRLKAKMEKEQGRRLSHLDQFSPGAGDTFCSTVDSFQGSEADVVVVSLVRNNQFTKPGQALGFLRDPRRMNVLLSRARWKLILVGSFGFLRSVISTVPNEPDGKLAFLKTLTATLDEGLGNGRIGSITPGQVLKGSGQ